MAPKQEQHDFMFSQIILCFKGHSSESTCLPSLWPVFKSGLGGGGGGDSVEIDTICGLSMLLIFLPWSKTTKQTLSNESFEILRALFNC